MRKVLNSVVRRLTVKRQSSCGTTNKANRDDWLKRTLMEIQPGARILDAGAGELRYREYCEHLQYVSQDFGRYDGEGDGRGLHPGNWNCADVDIVGDIANIPEPDASFDAVMCVEVFEHLPDPISALRELTRLLKRGGVLIVTAPFCSLTHFAPYFFHTGYSRYFYEHWLEKFGYALEDVYINGNYFEYLAQEVQRLPSVCNKFTHSGLSRTERKAIATILYALERLSSVDIGSDQLLAYGLCVKGRKK